MKVSALTGTSNYFEDFKVGEVDVSVHGAASFGTVIRTDKPDPQLMNVGNARSIGLFANGAGRNSDDGNLNFGQGDPVSTVLKGWASLEAKYAGYGVFVRAKGWTDFTLEDHGVP